jgi:ABC-type multidrug transport system fused ATPase/permease subunit
VFATKTASMTQKRFLSRLLKAPMSFFDSTPSARVLSRATKDQEYYFIKKL